MFLVNKRLSLNYDCLVHSRMSLALGFPITYLTINNRHITFFEQIKPKMGLRN